MAEGRERHERSEPGKRWGEPVRQRHEPCPATALPPYRTKSGTDVEQRRHLIVALLHHHQDGLTAREIREAIGLSRSLTDSAISGLFIRGIVHKHGHRYVLEAQEDSREHEHMSCSVAWCRPLPT